jgi:thymidylate synthase (FAD)
MEVKLISVTPEAEKLMGYCARVSNPANQDNPDVAKLLAYCIKHQHWSIFEQADMTVEIETSRAIGTQILRHRSFTFQEFSQRYAEANMGFEGVEARRQDVKNRQNSLDDLPEETKEWFKTALKGLNTQSEALYQEALAKGIAKEQARFMLNLNVKTKLYMKGNLRSWVHYLTLRTAKGTQKEHRQIALAIKDIFMIQFPIVSKALGWTNENTRTTN